jgi:hypothetical protein
MVCACAPLGAQGGATLSTPDRVLLAEYRAIGRNPVPMLIATTPAQTGAVVSALEKRDGRILSRRDAIGYVYAWVPLDAVASVLPLKGVEAARVASFAVRGDMAVSTGKDEGGAAASKKIRKGLAPSAALERDNPYTSEAVTQALDFKTRNPTFDGRGVVTAFVEPVAPNLETMRGALDLAGRPLEKIGRYVVLNPGIAEEPVSEAKNQLFVWQRTESVEPAADGTFRWRDREYRLPADVAARETTWRMARRLANPLMVEHDILWAQNRDRVWALPVSAGGDFSKARSASLRDAVPWIALDTPAETAGNFVIKALVIQADRERGWVAVVPTMAAHAGMVGSVMAGSGFLNSKADGVAPAAQIAIFLGAGVSGAPSLDGHEHMLEMMLDSRVDVAQASYALGDTTRFGTASIQSLWADRIIGRNGKPFVKAAGNFGTHIAGSSEFEMAESVFAVGGYVPHSAWRANFGFEPPGQHVLASYSGWGPAADGGLKPDFLSLTHTLSEGDGFKGYWDGETGDYNVSGGTSAAGPHGAGHIALLVSAAKQLRVAHDAPRLRAAIASTAKFLDGVEARAQGHGLVQVSDAWEALKRASSWQPPRFRVSAPLVGAEASPNGPPRFTGRGLFELSGWKPGRSGVRELTVTRIGGAASANRYALRWKGHTDVFQSERKEIELPLGKPVAIPVNIRVKASGSYSAILDLIDPEVQLVAGSILNTVMVSDSLAPDGEGLRYEREAPRLGSSLFYVDVPAGLSALTVSVEKDGGNGFLFVTDPSGREMPFNPYGSEAYRFDIEDLARREIHLTLPDPVPGVWQLSYRNAEPRQEKDFEAVEDWSRPMPLKVHVQGWTRAGQENLKRASGPATERIFASHPASSAVDVNFTAASGVGDTFVEPVGLGSAQESRATLRPGLEPVFYDVRVEPGTASLDVRIEHADPQARVGLYVFKVPEGERRESTLTSDLTALVYYDASSLQAKNYTLQNPAPGVYRIGIDPISVPDGGIEVMYRDVVHHPLFGAVSVSAEHSATVDVRAKPADGRRLYAEVGLFKRVNPKAPALLARKGWFVE